MLLITIASTQTFTSLSPVSPFVYSQLFSYTIADWWKTTFGEADETFVRSRPLVLNVRVDDVDYTRVDTYAECEALESSWFLSDEAFFIHMDHAIIIEGVIKQFGDSAGFSDKGVVYVDRVEYLPLITSSPVIDKQEDIQGYSKLRLNAGTVILANNDGRLDYLKDSSVIGNDAKLDYLPDEAITDNMASASDVSEQLTYFVENAEYGANEVVLSLQDNRKLDRIVPTRILDDTTYPNLDDNLDGQTVPLVYGVCRAVECFPLNTTQTGTTSVTFRCAELLTAISEVRVKIDDTWTVVATSSTDLANGIFTVANARAAINEDPYECQADVTGIAVTYAPDIIVDLYSRYLDQSFIDTFYDTTTWNTNKIGISTVGLVIDSPTSILDIIPLVQNGCWPGFSFDINVSGKKTISRDDRTKPVDWTISALEVVNIDTLKVQETSDYLFGSVTVKYDKNHFQGRYRSVTDSTYESSVEENYQWSNTVELDTLLTNTTDASAMVSAKSLEYSLPIKTVSPVVFGDRFFDVKLYDIVQVDTAMGRGELYTGEFVGREYYGALICQVISVAPDYKTLTTNMVLRVLDRAVDIESHTLILTEDDYYLGTEDGLRLMGE